MLHLYSFLLSLGFPSSPLAEREGFEPPEPLSSTVFKTAAIDHSAISPSVKHNHFPKSGAKVLLFFELCKFLIKNLAYMQFL